VGLDLHNWLEAQVLRREAEAAESKLKTLDAEWMTS
jgi:hypothetical protein